MSDERLRIVYVTSRWNQPTETFVRREVAAAIEAGCEIQVVSLQSPGEPDGIVDERAIRIVVPSLSDGVRGISTQIREQPRATLRSLARILRHGRPGTWIAHLRAWVGAMAVVDSLDPPDVHLAHFAWLSSTVADVLGELTGRPFAVFAHAHAIFEERCRDRYLTSRLRRAAVVFVESDLIADEVRAGHAVEPVVMRIGVPPDYVAERPRDTSTDDPTSVVSVGALRGKKGHDLLIRAVARVDDMVLSIAGDGPLDADLRDLAASCGVTDRVDLLGRRSGPEIRDLLDAATIFCLASRETPEGDRDGVPNVLIEAMARGVPVVSTAISGIPDLLGDGRGVVVPADDEEALVGALRAVADSRPDMERRVDALEHVREWYTSDRNWARLESTLRARIAIDPLAGDHEAR